MHEGYSNTGSYAGYNKNHKERAALDYYSTPTEEVVNILQTLNIDFNNQTILEPSAGGGHMVQGILDYIKDKEYNTKIIATDVATRKVLNDGIKIQSGEPYDFFSKLYPYTENIDWIIMNPPYSVIEPFTVKSLEVANKGVIMLARLQFFETEKRFKNIFKESPPTDVYVYVDRISCHKNGDITQKMASIQAYAWFIWDFKKQSNTTELRFIRRKGKC